MVIKGRVTSRTEGKHKGFYVFCPVSDAEYDRIISTHKAEVLVDFEDGRHISIQQRRKIYALIGCVADWSGYTPMEAMKELLKLRFLELGSRLDMEGFSLSDVDMSTARDFITWLIEFCLIQDIPCREPLWRLCEDMPKYIYACLLNKRCCVCEGKAELHHYDAVGMGKNRKETCHIGMRCLPLCRTHHNEIHQDGKESFCRRYMVEPIRIDHAIARKYKLKHTSRRG